MAEHIRIQFDAARFTARLQRFLAATQQEAERAVFETAAQVLGDVVAGWPVDTGASRGAWYGPRKIAPLAYQIGNPLGYASVIEYGGFLGPGPKTILLPGERLTGDFQINPGIYARQKPSAPLRRALAKNYGRLTTELRKVHLREWGR